MRPKAKFETIDSLRFEVAFVDKHELYAWPGSRKFDETNLVDMVPEGAANATGAFAGHAQHLFRSNAAIVKSAIGCTKAPPLCALSFIVPPKRSRSVLMKSKQNQLRRADAIPERLDIQNTDCD